MKKINILALILVFCMLFTALPMQSIADTPAEIIYWTDEGAYDTSWFNNDSVEFEISTAEQLAGFMSLVENGKTFKDITIKLTANIDLSKYSSQSIGIGGTEFNGIFDGDGYRISGIANYEGPCEGLFWNIDTNAIIKNLGVDGEFGGNTCGGLVYENKGYITNCFNLGSVTGFGCGGGIACYNSGTIRNCANLGAINGEYYGGGIAGNNSGIIENCYNSGDINYTKNAAGGIAGRNDYKVGCCYSTGKITVGEGVAFGGVIGSNNGEVYYDYYLKKTSGINDRIYSVGATWNEEANNGEGQDEKNNSDLNGTDSFMTNGILTSNGTILAKLNEATAAQNAVILQYESLTNELLSWKQQVFHEYPVFINSRVPVCITASITISNDIVITNDVIIQKSGSLTINGGNFTIADNASISNGKNSKFIVKGGRLANHGVIDEVMLTCNSRSAETENKEKNHYNTGYIGVATIVCDCLYNCGTIDTVNAGSTAIINNITNEVSETTIRGKIKTANLSFTSTINNIDSEIGTVNAMNGTVNNTVTKADAVATINTINMYYDGLFNNSVINNLYVISGSIENNGEIGYMSYTSGTIINRGTITKTDYCVLGDVNRNAKIGADDALLALCSSVGKITLPDIEYGFADVNGDSSVDASDALIILQYSVQKINAFPADTNYADYTMGAGALNQFYFTDLFSISNKFMTVGEYKNILINVLGFDERYVNAQPPSGQDSPCESDDYFFPWTVNDDDLCSKDELIYYMVKTYCPKVVADVDGITEAINTYSGIYLAKKYCNYYNINWTINKSSSITVGEFANMMLCVCLTYFNDVIYQSVDYLNNKYNTELFTTRMEPVTTQYIKDILVEVFDKDKAYVDALPSDDLPLPQESAKNFFPWNLDSNMILPRGIVYYAAVKAFDPNVVADWSSISDDTGVYPGIRVAENFCKNNGITGSINRNDKITFADVAVLFAQLDKLYSEEKQG